MGTDEVEDHRTSEKEFYFWSYVSPKRTISIAAMHSRLRIILLLFLLMRGTVHRRYNAVLTKSLSAPIVLKRTLQVLKENPCLFDMSCDYCSFLLSVVVLSFTLGFGVCSPQQMTTLVQEPVSIPALDYVQGRFSNTL